MSSSADIVSTLFAHGMIIGRNTNNRANTSANSSNTVLAVWTTEGCTNPNCKAKKHSTHTTVNCYWPGGRKEGQFPPNFGQKSQANVATNTPTPNQPEHFMLLAQTPNTSGHSGILIDTPNNHPTKALISKGFQNFQKRENTNLYGLWS